MWQVKQTDQALRQYGQRPVAKTGEGEMWDQVIEKILTVMRLEHLSLNTEKTYTTWRRQFQLFIKRAVPSDPTTDDTRKFLFYLAVERKIAASTQNQAINAVLFPFRHGLNKPGELLDTVGARKKRGLPVMSSAGKVSQMFDVPSRTMRLMAMQTLWLRFTADGMFKVEKSGRGY